jgi:hypothetical protein
MKAQAYSERENELIAAAYATLAAGQLHGVKVKKVTLVAELVAATGRSRGSIESKLMNYSAAAVAAGLLPELENGYVKGYKPAHNGQKGIWEYLQTALYAAGQFETLNARIDAGPRTVVLDPIACFGRK